MAKAFEHLQQEALAVTRLAAMTCTSTSSHDFICMLFRAVENRRARNRLLAASLTLSPTSDQGVHQLISDALAVYVQQPQPPDTAGLEQAIAVTCYIAEHYGISSFASVAPRVIDACVPLSHACFALDGMTANSYGRRLVTLESTSLVRYALLSDRAGLLYQRSLNYIELLLTPASLYIDQTRKGTLQHYQLDIRLASCFGPLALISAIYESISVGALIRTQVEHVKLCQAIDGAQVANMSSAELTRTIELARIFECKQLSFTDLGELPAWMVFRAFTLLAAWRFCAFACMPLELLELAWAKMIQFDCYRRAQLWVSL